MKQRLWQQAVPEYRCVAYIEGNKAINNRFTYQQTGQQWHILSQLKLVLDLSPQIDESRIGPSIFL